MRLDIDSVSADFGYKDIELPLYVQITGEGYIRYKIEGDGVNINDSEDTFLTVKCNKNKISAVSTTKSMRFNGTVAFSIVDETKQSFKAGTVFNISINNDFYFISANSANGSGKFENACEFNISESNPSKASIIITKDTECNTGKIGISGLKIQKSNKDIYDTVMISVKLNDDEIFTDMSWSTAVGKYTASAKDEDFGIEISTMAHPSLTTESTTESTTAATNNSADSAFSDVTANIDFGMPVIPDAPPVDILKIPIGEAYYTIGGKAYSTDAAAYISDDNYTMLPLRAVANALGITNDKISYDAKTFTATLVSGNTTVSITKGQQQILINGKATAIPTKAEIKKDRLFVPLRAIANAFGIENSKISYDDKNRIVSINLY
jgi:hypothetical protein